MDIEEQAAMQSEIERLTAENKDFQILYEAQSVIIHILTGERNEAQAQAAKSRLFQADVIRLTAERNDLFNRATTAEFQRDAALVDAKRMDWLEAHKRPAEIYVDGVPHGCNHYGIAAATNLTLRAAIDAAMETTE